MFSEISRGLSAIRGGAWLLPLILVSGASGRVLITAEEALHLAFPEAQTAKQTILLTTSQKQAAEKICRVPVPAIVVRFLIKEQEAVVAVAYVDTHRVRTLPETLLVTLDPQGRVLRVEVLAFGEPLDYLPKEPWYRQFQGRQPANPPLLGRDIRPVTGATLTAHATAEAVRRVLALHEVLGL